MAVVLALPTGAGAGSFSVTSIAGVFQGDAVQVKVYKSSNGKYLGDVAQATTIAGCAAAAGHTVWIIDGEGGQSAKVYDSSDCTDSFSTATFAFDGGYVRVCTAEPGSTTPPTSSAPTGTLPGTVGATGCADLKQISKGEEEGTPHTVGDYVKNIRRGRCVLKNGPTSFFVRIANVADDKAVKVRFSNNGEFAQTGQKSGKEYRFDLPAKKGANHVKVIVKTFHGKTYKRSKTFTC